MMTNQTTNRAPSTVLDDDDELVCPRCEGARVVDGEGCYVCWGTGQNLEYAERVTYDERV